MIHVNVLAVENVIACVIKNLMWKNPSALDGSINMAMNAFLRHYQNNPISRPIIYQYPATIVANQYAYWPAQQGRCINVPKMA
ncbi:hypothetical protein BCU94_14650 [Shewanella sp. 10N.286.52.C2]|nr:hypothetical protein BCU94_14650 [Shewanella sp. 10N.286.52.C2]